MTWRSIKYDPHPNWDGTFLLCDCRVGGGHVTAADWDWSQEMWFSAELLGYASQFFTHWWDFGDGRAMPDTPTDDLPRLERERMEGEKE